MIHLGQFDGTLCKNGDGTPLIVFGMIEELPETGRWRGEITSTMSDRYLQRIVSSPKDWLLTPAPDVPLRIIFDLSSGALAFEGEKIT